MLIDNNKNTLTNNCDYNTTTIKKDWMFHLETTKYYLFYYVYI